MRGLHHSTCSIVFRNIFKILVLIFLFINCKDNDTVRQNVGEENTMPEVINQNEVSLVILGTVQDAGSPHIACKRDCCKNLFMYGSSDRQVVSLGLIDHENQKTFLFEATPDISQQAKLLKNNASWDAQELPDGVFLTHAHIGHYAGLMYLGKEATNAKKIPVYTMPKMQGFLQDNGPWSQLVTNKNIDLKSISDSQELQLTTNVKIAPFTVPHRDEYSETVGYRITGPNKTVLFIPDIDKWGKWDQNIIDAIAEVDYAFLDATFFDAKEINNRNISEIPHPFVVESMTLFEDLPFSEKKKVHFIHFNHTNPLLNEDSAQTKEVIKKGFNIAKSHMLINL